MGTALGVVLANSDWVQVIPYGGLVYSWLGVRVSNTQLARPTFGGYLAGPANQLHVATNGFLGHLGLHLAKPRLGNGALGRKLVLGLRTGYCLPLGKAIWKNNSVMLTDGPRANAGGVYVNGVLGVRQ